MTSKYGPNGEQVAAFLHSALGLTRVHVENIAPNTRRTEVRDAWTRVNQAPIPAAQYSAIDSAVRDVEKAIRASYPLPVSTADRFTITKFMSLLGAAAFALAARPKLDEETVGLVVDPFADVLGFNWRYTGVSSTAGKDTP